MECNFECCILVGGPIGRGFKIAQPRMDHLTDTPFLWSKELIDCLHAEVNAYIKASFSYKMFQAPKPMPTCCLLSKRLKPFALLVHAEVLYKKRLFLKTVAFAVLDLVDRIQHFFLLRKLKLRYLPVESCFLGG